MESNIDVLKGLFELEGCNNIMSITDSRKVISAVKSFNPDLILLDLMMPNLSGFEVMKLLKEQQMTSLNPDVYLPILVLTADISPESKQKALRAGAKDFVSKPFDLIEVSLRIRNLLETQYLYQKLESQKQFFEEKIVEFLKINDEWYR